MQSDNRVDDVGSESNTEKAAGKNDVMKLLGSKNASNEGCETAFKLAPFNPSSDQIQKKALAMLDLGETDILFDLGCGDGRFLCFAATQIPGLRCVGIEILAEFVSRGRDRVKESHLEDRIDIRLEDATKALEQPNPESNESVTTRPVQELTLMSDATALYLFILPKGIVKMMPILEALKQKRLAEGKRFKVLSYMFKIHDWEATIIDETAKGSCPIYYYDFGA
mmetsp:Transcript_8985/g.18662  ORF Transcript_8985/g.18662 Transcript_8985/m.18662 type:complete len:224 (+) Transcript_8985:190-861(+)